MKSIPINSQQFEKDHFEEKRWYLNTYSQYLDDPHNDSNLREMCSAIREMSHIASFWSQDLYSILMSKMDIIKNRAHQKRILYTNGSTKTEYRPYSWGPNFEEIESAIWDFAHRFFKVEKKIWIEFQTGRPGIPDPKRIRCCGQTCVFDPRRTDPEDFQNTVWISNPPILHQFLSDRPEIIDFIKNTGSSVSLTELPHTHYDFSILDNSGIKWIDQMRSWNEGTVFYTCPEDHETRLFMENIFYSNHQEPRKIVDFFNLVDPIRENPDEIWPTDNQYFVNESGVVHREHSFRPYAVKWFIDVYGKPSPFRFSRFLEDTAPAFKFFQVIQTISPNKFSVRTDKEIDKDGIRRIESFIESVYGTRSVEIEYLNKPYLIGSFLKQPIFWSEAKRFEPPDSKKFVKF